MIVKEFMLYSEFVQYEELCDPDYPVCHMYKTKRGHFFYVEPGFYEGLIGYKEKRSERYQELLASIYSVIERTPRLVLVGDFEHPIIEKEGFVYREIGDFADALCIFVEDKSRGSDYGD